MRTPIMLATGLFLFGAMAANAMAEKVTYKATLQGANEVPANDSPAIGEALAVFDTQSREFEWTVTYSNTTGPLIGAHFHGPAAQGANAGVLIPMVVADSEISGKTVLSEEQVGFLEAGSIYANLHTEKFPGGELRGNLVAE